MLSARTDQKVLGYLGRSLSLELSAVQLYSTQARLLKSWGLTEAADKLSAEAMEEMGHVNRIIERMLALGVAPNASQLRPVKLGRSLTDILLVNQAFEKELIQLYQNAATHCAQAGVHDDKIFFEGLLNEEKQHYDDLVAWRNEILGETGSRPVRNPRSRALRTADTDL